MHVPDLRLFGDERESRSVKVQLRFAILPESDDRDRYRNAVDLFVECAAGGAFCEQAVAPSAWTPTRVEWGWTAESLDATFLANAIDVRGLQILRNLMLGAAGPDDSLHQIVVSGFQFSREGTDGRTLPMVTEDNEEDAYPPMSEHLGFDCLEEEIDDTWVRRCVVEYRDPVAPEEVGRVESLVLPWFNALASGGYALPLGPPSTTGSVPGSVAQFDDVSIEVSVMKFHASDMAWNSLANMLSAGMLAKAPIARLLLE